MTERRAILNSIAQLEKEIHECLAAADRWTGSAEAKKASIENLKTMLTSTKRVQKKLAAYNPESFESFVDRVIAESGPTD